MGSCTSEPAEEGGLGGSPASVGEAGGSVLTSSVGSAGADMEAIRLREGMVVVGEVENCERGTPFEGVSSRLGLKVSSLVSCAGACVFFWKKPCKVRWPFCKFDDEPVDGAALGFLFDCAVTDGAEIFLFVGVGAGNWSLDDHRGVGILSGDWTVTGSGCESSRVTVGCDSKVWDPLEVWRLNMSLMLRLLSNSGINLAEKGGRSFAL
jgi:hypothetical protein